MPLSLARPASQDARQFFLGPLRRGGADPKFVDCHFVEFVVIFVLFGVYWILAGFSAELWRFSPMVWRTFLATLHAEGLDVRFGRKLDVVASRMRTLRTSAPSSLSAGSAATFWGRKTMDFSYCFEVTFRTSSCRTS